MADFSERPRDRDGTGSVSPDDARVPGLGPGKQSLLSFVQRRAGDVGLQPDIRADDVHAAAQQGVSGGSGALPHLDTIQAMFGRHDVTHIKAHTGAVAEQATQRMGAQAFATGDHVVFGGTPDLHTAAHEAAHVVQQRAGVQLLGGRGEAGDVYETHADQVAHAVVAGRSAEALLDHLPSAGTGGPAVQCLSWDRADDTIWTQDFGRAFEEAEGANIAGNYPTIDDFRDGVGTSLKAMDLVHNYQGPNGLQNLWSALNEHLNALKGFAPRSYGGKQVKSEDVHELTLKIAVPPAKDCAPEQIALLNRFAASTVDPATLIINQGRARRANSRHKSQAEKTAAEGEPTTTLSIVIEHRDDLPWGDNPGTRYEKAKDANIAGNFPTIDDFRGGVATSYKTINIVENYKDDKDLKRVIDGYVRDLEGFRGANWPLGSNAHVDPSLIRQNSSGAKYIVVQENEIKKKVLMMAIPPVSKLLDNGLRGKKVETTTRDEHDADAMEVTQVGYEAPSTADVDALKRKIAYLMSLNGKTEGSVQIGVEEVK